MIYFLYLLRHQVSNQVVYVGCTTKYLERWYKHKYYYKDTYGYEPIIEIVEAYWSNEQAQKREWELIKHYRQFGQLNQKTDEYRPGGMLNNAFKMID